MGVLFKKFKKEKMFLVTWLIFDSRIVDFGVKISLKHCNQSMHLEKVTLFGAVYGLVVSSLKMSGTVNAIVTDFFLSKMQKLGLHDMWFNGSHMPHSTRSNGLNERRVR